MPAHILDGPLPLTPHGLDGKLIVLSGTDGVGKSTLLGRAETALEAQGLETYRTRLPSDFIRGFRPFVDYKEGRGRDGYSYRAIAMTVMADRVQRCERDLLPALSEGKVVLLDRYVYTGWARLALWGDPSDAWFREACRHLVAPDLVVLLHALPAVIRSRLQARTDESPSPVEVDEILRVQTLLIAIADLHHMVSINTSASTVEETFDRELLPRLTAVCENRLASHQEAAKKDERR